MPALASSRAAQPPQAPEPTTMASNGMVFRMSAGGKFGVVRVALVIKRFDHTGARGVKSKRVLLLDEPVSGKSRMACGAIALRFRHRLHQPLAVFRDGGVEAGLLQRRHCVAPLLLQIGNAIGCLQDE